MLSFFLFFLSSASIQGESVRGTLSQVSHPSSADCQWKFISQPLSHFSRGITSEPIFFQQRVCVYDGYWEPHVGLPVFFYTGNVSHDFFSFENKR